MGRRERCRKITEVRGKLEVGGETGGSERRGGRELRCCDKGEGRRGGMRYERRGIQERDELKVEVR